MCRVGRVRDTVHRSYKEHNRWMYVAPVREAFTLKDLMDVLLIVLAFGVLVFEVAVIIVLLLM